MRYFGTDGIRGVANKDLSAELAFKIGALLGHKYDKVVIGKDTRISSSMLESALACGLSAYGADVYKIGYTTTPCLAYNTALKDFDCGVMISASHNPYYDNGIKIFAKNGLKIDSAIEEEIEDYIDGKFSIQRAKSEDIGEIYSYHQGIEAYTAWLNERFCLDLKGLRVVFDLANGGAVFTFDDFKQYLKGAKITVINDHPDGLNINVHCGSTHLESLKAIMKSGDYDVGFAFDGDADRVLAVDNKGDVVDGDMIMYILSNYLKEKGRLKDDTLVTTVMSNIGLYKALANRGLKSEKTAVGDKNVAELMIRKDYSIGGEQSGHIIIKEDGMFGDGLKSALWVLKVMSETGRSLCELCQDLKIYPQLLLNKKVQDKDKIMQDEVILDYIAKVEALLEGEGRILVRPSGTEPLIRVMVEARSDEECERLANDILKVIAARGYLKEEL